METTTIIYWVSTILFSGVILMSGIGTLKSPKLINDFKRLGFPDYFRKQVAKIHLCFSNIRPSNLGC